LPPGGEGEPEPAGLNWKYRLRELKLESIGAALATHGFDMNSASKICRLLLCSLYMSGALAQSEPNLEPLSAIREAAEGFVRSQIPGDSKTAVVTAAQLDSRLRLAKCSAPLSASLTQGAHLQARTAVGVSCKAGATWTVYVPVSVESEIGVLVLKESAARGARITADSCTIQKRRVSGFAESYITDTASLARRTLKRSVPAGTALTADMLVADFVVKKGDQVTLLASTGGFEVRAYGRALSDGQDGARIKAQNLSSLKVVEGVVDASGVIRVAP
jgi:flagella basal body P-ring formation protein FlgA